MNGDIIENLSMASPEDPWLWLWILLSAALIVLLGGWWFFGLRARRRLPFQRHSAPSGEIALERLAAILHLIELGLFKEFARQASDILRSHIEARFGLRAPRLSTEEFLFEAERSRMLDESARIRLADFLYCCDQVKFALGTLDRSGMIELHRVAVAFIAESSRAGKTESAAE